MLTIVQHVGGVALGAFDARDQLVGFVFGVTGIIDGQPVHWSHMLAVDERCRDQGVGRQLKTAQRDVLLERGVARARWSFDPLVARNAYLNLVRLGTEVVEFVEDMYGENPMSVTDSIIGSDRLIVEWDLIGPVTADTAEAADAPLVALEHGSADDLPSAPRVRIAVPRDIQVLKHRDPERARMWRTVTSRAFRHYIALGYRVAGFHRGRPGARSTYLLGAVPAST
jgi:predicted GNAT superfamily acetyltransferase